MRTSSSATLGKSDIVVISAGIIAMVSILPMTSLLHVVANRNAGEQSSAVETTQTTSTMATDKTMASSEGNAMSCTSWATSTQDIVLSFASDNTFSKTGLTPFFGRYKAYVGTSAYDYVDSCSSTPMDRSSFDAAASKLRTLGATDIQVICMVLTHDDGSSDTVMIGFDYIMSGDEHLSVYDLTSDVPTTEIALTRQAILGDMSVGRST